MVASSQQAVFYVNMLCNWPFSSQFHLSAGLVFNFSQNTFGYTALLPSSTCKIVAEKLKTVVCSSTFLQILLGISLCHWVMQPNVFGRKQTGQHIMQETLSALKSNFSSNSFWYSAQSKNSWRPKGSCMVLRNVWVYFFNFSSNKLGVWYRHKILSFASNNPGF